MWSVGDSLLVSAAFLAILCASFRGALPNLRDPLRHGNCSSDIQSVKRSVPYRISSALQEWSNECARFGMTLQQARSFCRSEDEFPPSFG